MRLFARTIQRKLLLILLAVGFAPAIAAVVYISWGTMVGLDRVLGTFLQERAESAAAVVDISLQRYYKAVGNIRSSVEAGKDLGQVSAEEGGMFDTVVTCNESGVVVRDNGSTHPATITLPAALFRDSSSKGVFLDEVIEGSYTTRLIFVAPLTASDESFVVCTVPSTRVVELAPLGRISSLAFINVFSNRGQFVAGLQFDEFLQEFILSNYSELRQGFGGFGRYKGANEKRSIYGYAVPKVLRLKQREGMTSVDWLITAKMDLGDVIELVTFLLWRLFFLGIVLIPLLIVASFWLARRFIRPIRTLQNQVEHIAGGDLSARVNLSTGDELDDLADSFNLMAMQLSRSRTELDTQIRNVESKARQLELVTDVGRSIVGAFDLPRLLETAHSQLHVLLPYDALAITIFGQKGTCELYRVAGDVFSPQAEPEEVRLFCEEQLLAIKLEGEVLPLAGHYAGEPILNETLAQFCLVPLRVEKGLMGTLILGRISGEDFTGEERRALAQVSQVIALAIEHIDLYDRAKDFAKDLERKVRQRAQELEAAQERLLQTERLAATGRLSANIAHEINNPLGIIKNYLRILAEGANRDPEETREVIGIIGEELERVARIVRTVLDFYRPSRTKLVPLQLNEEIVELMPLMQAGLRQKNIRVEFDLAPDLPRPLLSPDQIRQVLLNLFKNAEDAIPDSGFIRIVTEHLVAADEEFVILKVADSGCGIPMEDLPHIFEPFFTRKRDGQGTGLGLSVTYSIVRNIGGKIEVDSQEGKGSTFTIRIPVAPDRAAIVIE